jgi:superfamily II DNA or RNA helicase
MKHLEKGYPRHLDNTSSTEERKDILQWFKKTPDAILTSVGILQLVLMSLL